jgi:exodeoxyribonuclease-5
MTSHLTKEQRAVIKQLLKNLGREQVQTLGGYAGTGKTTVAAVLAERLPTFTCCAYTGKAAYVMRTKGMDASTIHASIYVPVPQPGGGVVFRLKQPYELGARGFLVDEASMVSSDVYRDLVGFGLPVIFVGDHGQLPPVGSDVNVMADPQLRLETLHRNAGEIAHFAEHLRKGKRPRSFAFRRRVRVVESGDVTDTMLLEAGQMICAFNHTRVGLNRRSRCLRGRTALLEKGDRVICLRNSRDAGLFNGQHGRVLAVRAGPVPRLDFRSGGLTYEGLAFDPAAFGNEKPTLDYNPRAPHPFDYAYCITAHKSQGSEWKRVTVFEQPCRHWDHRRWAYTAASRAKRFLTWVAVANTPVIQSVSKPSIATSVRPTKLRRRRVQAERS